MLQQSNNLLDFFILFKAKADREASKFAMEEKDRLLKEKDIEIAKVLIT